MTEENSCTDGGVCSLHTAEIERRREYVDNLSAVNGRVAELLTFKNRLVGFSTGVGVFATIVILGSYTYTYNHMKDAESKYAELASQTKRVDDIADTLRREVYDTRVQLARTDERYQALQNQLRSIDSRLEQLLSKIESRGQ